MLRIKPPSHQPRTKRPLSCIQPSIKLHHLNHTQIIPTVQLYRPTLPLPLSIYGRVVLCGHPHNTVREILGKLGGLFYSLYVIHLNVCNVPIIMHKFYKAVMVVNRFVSHSSVCLLLVVKIILWLFLPRTVVCPSIALVSVACEAL